MFLGPKYLYWFRVWQCRDCVLDDGFNNDAPPFMYNRQFVFWFGSVCVCKFMRVRIIIESGRYRGRGGSIFLFLLDFLWGCCVRCTHDYRGQSNKSHQRVLYMSTMTTLLQGFLCIQSHSELCGWRGETRSHQTRQQ